MALRKGLRTNLIIISFLITTFLLFSVIILGSVFESQRKDYLNEQLERLYRDFINIQVYSLLSESYDNDMACLAFESKLLELDTYIWELGQKIDKYRSAREEFQKDEYYLNQKRIFNENQLFYLLLMDQMIDKCNITKQTVLFFYRNSADCPKCDDQSFILTDISMLDDRDGSKEVAIFSFDMDLDLSMLNILARYYKIDEYPCLVINDYKACGIQDKSFIMNRLCEDDGNMDICTRYFK